VVHAKAGDTPVNMAERGVEMILPAINDGEGIKLKWRVATEEGEQLTSFPIVQFTPDKKGDFVRSVVDYPLINPEAEREVREMNQYLHESGKTVSVLKQLLMSDRTRMELKDRSEQIAQIKGPKKNINLLVTAFESMPEIEGEPETLEQALLQKAFTIEKNSVFVSRTASVKNPDRVAQVVAINRVHLSQDEAEDGEMFNQKKTETVRGAFEMIAGAGFGETRIHILQKDDFPDEITCIAVMDDPLISAPKTEYLSNY
jgi:hypothetical protein